MTPRERLIKSLMCLHGSTDNLWDTVARHILKDFLLVEKDRAMVIEMKHDDDCPSLHLTNNLCKHNTCKDCKVAKVIIVREK